MSSKGPERAPSPELREVNLDEVNEQDMIVLQTTDGMYRLTVVESRHGSSLVVIDEQSDHLMHANGQPIAANDSSRFNLLGSCRGFLSAADGEGLMPVGPINKLLAVGKRVRLQSEKGEPRFMSAVTRIEWVKADNE